LDGKNDINYKQVAEVYWRFVLNDYVAVIVYAQYMQDEYNTDEDDMDGFILGPPESLRDRFVDKTLLLRYFRFDHRGR
jgi:hypothetical protein